MMTTIIILDFTVKPSDIKLSKTVANNHMYLASSYCFTVNRVSSIVLKHKVLREFEKNVIAPVHKFI